ncbi:hypothetical protein CCH79_00013920 [Gambusia affinis]|uniref:Uncharacterized protein n=1 Tax=Gambusia affinis TaxID=33528 RepID=A0A315W0I5_GAMAF|nr:hypothetical protein CCH79_00013920 [Gambusia affinis]
MWRWSSVFDLKTDRSCGEPACRDPGAKWRERFPVSLLSRISPLRLRCAANTEDFKCLWTDSSCLAFSTEFCRSATSTLYGSKAA